MYNIGLPWLKSPSPGAFIAFLYSIKAFNDNGGAVTGGFFSASIKKFKFILKNYEKNGVDMVNSRKLKVEINFR